MAIRKSIAGCLIAAATQLQQDQSKEMVLHEIYKLSVSTGKEINKARTKLANWIKPK
jgi:hypothetical protein